MQKLYHLPHKIFELQKLKKAIYHLLDAREFGCGTLAVSLSWVTKFLSCENSNNSISSVSQHIWVAETQRAVLCGLPIYSFYFVFLL